MSPSVNSAVHGSYPSRGVGISEESGPPSSGARKPAGGAARGGRTTVRSAVDAGNASMTAVGLDGGGAELERSASAFSGGAAGRGKGISSTIVRDGGGGGVEGRSGRGGGAGSFTPELGVVAGRAGAGSFTPEVAVVAGGFGAGSFTPPRGVVVAGAGGGADGSGIRDSFASGGGFSEIGFGSSDSRGGEGDGAGGGALAAAGVPPRGVIVGGGGSEGVEA
jgi:hypothetical protein